MNIYSKCNILRSNLHASEDSELIQEISGEDYVNVKLSSNYFIPFQIGDYVTVYGSTYRLKKIPAPIDKNGSNRFEYTLKFESNRADLADVNLQLFDNTTVEVVPAYNPSTTYSSGNVVSYHTLHWQYINATPRSGNTPAENDYWALKSTVTNYVPDYSAATNYTYGNIVSYNNNYYMHIGPTDTAGVHPVEGEHWTVVKTAPQWDFSTILTPTRYAQLIVDNMNRARPNQTWTVGYCVPSEPKETTFSNVKCLEACSSIAELFETEFWVDGYSINFGKRSNATAITMAYGKGNGFKKVTRNEVTESRVVTRLIALGAEKNLLGTYRNGSNRLMLPNKYYLDAVDIDLSSPMEDTQTWDEIYPTMQHATENYNNTTTYYVGNQVLYSGYSWDCIEQCTGVNPVEGSYWKYSEGTVTTSLGQYKLIDKNLSFDPLSLDVRMKDGTIPKIKFFTGNLAGYEFPITGYIADTKQITIQQISDSTDSLLPTASYGFKVGDRFGFVDLYMPSTYVQKAEARLLAKAKEFLDKYSVDQVSYAGEVDEIWATTNSIELKIGDLIHFNDPDFLISLDYRIVKLTRNLTRSYKYTIELSTLPYIPSKITSITNKITQNETYIEYNGLNKKMSKSKTFLGAHEAIDMAFDPAGDYFTDKIKPLIVETSALLVGTEQQQYRVTGLTFKSFASTPNIISWSAGNISDSSVEGIERVWNIAAGPFTATDANAAYYCYARCVRASGSTSAELKFYTAQHKTEEGTDYYYFLLGSLSSVINGMRQLYTSRGFTFINGDTIITGRIQSENGEVDIDLANETMHFGNDEKYIDYNNGTFKVKGNLVVSPSGIEFPMSCFRGEYNVSYAYYKGDEVTYLGSSYICIDNANAGVLPTNSGRWKIKSSKGDTGKGIDGGNTAIIYLYQRSASAPSLGFTNNLTYTFSTKTLSGNIGTWSKTIPSGSNPLYVVAATAYSNTDTDTIAYTEWSTPEILASNGTDGTDGTDGLNSATVHLYKRLSSIPAVPSTALTYTFATGLLSGNLYGWSQGMPASDGNPCYVTLATAVSVNATDSILSTEWNTPVILVEDGTTPVTIQITGKNIFKYPKNSTTPENTTVTLTATVQGLKTPDYDWGYMVGTTFNRTGFTNNTYSPNVSLMGAATSLVIRCYTNNHAQYDDYTLYKLYEGSDALNVVLTNESHTIACDKDGVPKTGEIAKANTNIQVYLGSVLLTQNTDWVIDELAPYGGNFSSSSSSVLFLNFENGSSSATCDIGIMIGSIYIYKTFSVSKSIDGQTGDTGSTGSPGPQGVAGPAGADGVAYYTWIRYADTSVGGGISNDPTGKLYIGFAYNKPTATESNTASDYTWSLIKGDKGDTGVQGATGANGITYYTWVKYSDNSDGAGLYDTPTYNTQYIGIAVNKTTSTESTVKTDYTWSKFKGDTGSPGNYFEHRYAVNGSPTDAPPINVSSSDPSIVVGEITYTWSLTLPTQGLMEYTWMTTAEKTSAGVLVANWSTPQRITGIQGETGSSGAAISYKGVWNSLVQYVGNSLVVNVVKDGSTYYIARIDAGVIPAGTSTSNTTYWNSIGTSFESIATGLLLAQSAYIENLIVGRLGTSANPSSERLSSIGSSLGIFRNLSDENSIDNAVIAFGKDLTVHQSSNERKPCFKVRDIQWKGTYSALTVYYKDDRVYYNNATYIFIKQWAEVETPNAGHTPPSYVDDYWSFIGSGNLGGGGYIEAGSEGVFCNGSNISMDIDGNQVPDSNSSGVFLLQKKTSVDTETSAGVLGVDQMYAYPTFYNASTPYQVGNIVYYLSSFWISINNSTGVTPQEGNYWTAYRTSKTCGGYFRRLRVDGVIKGLRRVSSSGNILKTDSRIHCYNNTEITLTLPIPLSSDIGLEIMIRNMGTYTVNVASTASFPIFNNAVHTSGSVGGYDLVSICWDGNYWVWNYMPD